MHFLQQLKTALFGWHVMQRQCYVERQSSMKNYEEFRGQAFKLEFDAASNSFIYVPLNATSQTKSATTILFNPKAKAPDKIITRIKTRKLA